MRRFTASVGYVDGTKETLNTDSAVEHIHRVPGANQKNIVHIQKKMTNIRKDAITKWSSEKNSQDGEEDLIVKPKIMQIASREYQYPHYKKDQ